MSNQIPKPEVEKSISTDEAEALETTLLQWRLRALHFLLVVIILLGVPRYVVPLLKIAQTEQSLWLLCVYWLVYLGLIGLALGPKLDYRIRGWGLLLLAYLNALSSFLFMGLAGSGRLYLVAIPIVATMLVSARAGYITMALSLFIYAVSAGLTRSPMLESWFARPTTNPLDLSVWVEAGITFVIFLVTIVILLQRFFRLQTRTLAAARHTADELKQMTEALREREERYALVIKGSNDGIWDWDLHTNDVYFSPRWKSMLGYADDELPNRYEQWERRLHPEDASRALNEVRAYLDGERPAFALEHRLQHKDGSYRWTLARGIALLDDEGRPYRMLGSHTDITERKQAEETLRRQNEQLAALREVSMDLTTTLDLREVLHRVAETAQRLTGSAHAHIFLYDEEKDELTLGARHWSPAVTPVPLQPRRQGTTYRVARSGVAEFIEDTSLTNSYSSLASTDRPGALAALPLKKGPKVLGTLNLGYWQPCLFDAETRTFLTLLSNEAAIAIENAQLYTAVQQHAHELEALHEIDLDISACLDLKALLSAIIRRGRQLLEVSAGDVYLFDPERQVLELSAQYGLQSNLVGTTLALGEGLSGLVAQERRPIAVDNYRQWENRAALYANEPIGAAAAVPLCWQDQLLGTMGLQVEAVNPRTFRPSDLLLMEKLAAQAAIAIQNARLFESISRRTDELRRRVHELAIVNEVSERVVTLDLQTAQRSALEHIYKTFRADRCAIALYQPDGHSLTITAIEPPDDPALGVTFEATDDPLLTEAIRLRDPVIWRDNPALLVPGNPLHAYFRARGIQLLLIAPLMVGEKAIGFLSVDPAGQGEFEIEQIKLLDTVANQVATALQNALLYDNQQRLNEELTRAYDNTLLGWAHALELRDKETQGHTLRVTELTIQLARKMGYGNSELVHIRRGALLHDIGKMGIPDAILHKPGSLNDDEWAVMRRHPQYAYEMLSSISYLAPSLEIPRYHHEKWDGSGYPCQLKGEAIPLPARVFAVVDVWDALCSDRPYRSAWPRERVLSHIRAGVGTHFDPRVSESFFELV